MQVYNQVTEIIRCLGTADSPRPGSSSAYRQKCSSSKQSARATSPQYVLKLLYLEVKKYNYRAAEARCEATRQNTFFICDQSQGTHQLISRALPVEFPPQRQGFRG